MKRVVSIGVLLVLMTTVLAPLGQASTSSLPVCCRVGGQHHCMGMPGMDGFQSLPSTCPYRVTPAVISGIAALVAVSLPLRIFAIETKTLTPPSPEPAPVAFGNVHKRGPPIG